MKKSGFSLLEIIVVTAIMGIVMLISSPMINAFIGAQDRLYNQSKVDSRLNEVVEFIKRDVRNARSVGKSTDSELKGEPVRVFDNGKRVIIYTTDLNGDPKYVQYTIDGSNLKLKDGDSFTTLGKNSTILSNIEIGEFKYKKRILLFHFKIDIPKRLEGKDGKKDKIRSEVRDVGITRINLE